MVRELICTPFSFPLFEDVFSVQCPLQKHHRDARFVRGRVLDGSPGVDIVTDGAGRWVNQWIVGQVTIWRAV
jgi:hypothetical protein